MIRLKVCNFEFGDNDYGVDFIVFNDASVYYKDLQTNVNFDFYLHRLTAIDDEKPDLKLVVKLAN